MHARSRNKRHSYSDANWFQSEIEQGRFGSFPNSHSTQFRGIRSLSSARCPPLELVMKPAFHLLYCLLLDNSPLHILFIILLPFLPKEIIFESRIYPPGPIWVGWIILQPLQFPPLASSAIPQQVIQFFDWSRLPPVVPLSYLYPELIPRPPDTAWNSSKGSRCLLGNTF